MDVVDRPLLAGLSATMRATFSHVFSMRRQFAR